MTKTKEKELTVREKAHPETYFGEVERYMDRLFRHPFSLLTPSFAGRDYVGVKELTPSVDVYEEGDTLVVKAELPGIKKEDLDVTISENRITLSGEKRHEKEVEKKNYHWCESSYGTFSRSFRLPDNVNGEAADAQFHDGVLEIRIPKKEETKIKKINVE